MVPEGAVREALISADVAVYDVHRLLPRRSAYPSRDPSDIRHVVVHKSGADGPPGFAGAVGMARFCVDHRGWPGAAYTYWVPREPDVDTDSRLVVYRCQPDEARSYHTGGAMNGRGVGVACQGNYDGEWDLVDGVPQVLREPTAAQLTALGAMVDWLALRHTGFHPGLDRDSNLWGLTGHWEHGKPVCPGDALRAWVELRRGGGTPPTPAPEPTPRRRSVREIQAALATLGFAPGPVDGVLGYRTRAALERFQASAKVSVDGWYGPETAAAMSAALKRIGKG